jgi:alpha-tubulin suppressor-like RCC1 family protein/type II secretory pathway pseudopilin PulG
MKRVTKAGARLRAFTLIELVITLTIIIAVTAFTIPQINSNNAGTLNTQAKATLNSALNAVVEQHARTIGTKELESQNEGLRTAAPAIERATVRALYPDLDVTDQGAPSQSTNEVSIDTAYNNQTRSWRVGMAVLARGGDNLTETATCYMAWRDIDPSVGSITRTANGPALETYYAVSASTENVLPGCTGTNALAAQISAEARAQNPQAGISPSTPAVLLSLPEPTSDAGSGSSITYPQTVFTQQIENSAGKAQTLTPTVTAIPAGAVYTLTGNLPTDEYGNALVTFSQETGTFTSPQVWREKYTAIDTDGNTTCAVTQTTREVRCWGLGTPGLVPTTLSGTSTDTTARPVDVTVSSNAAATAASVCVLYDDGAARCYGDNSTGQAGIGTIDSASTLNTPHAWVSGIGSSNKLTTIVSLSAGRGYTCAVLANGNVACWGQSGGTSHASNTSTPTLVTGINDAVQVTASTYTKALTCVTRSNGQAACWGNNSDGQLGDGTTTTRDTPAKVIAYPNGCEWVNEGGDGVNTCSAAHYGGNKSVALTSVTSISIGANHTCAVTRQGAKCWGSTSNSPSVLAGADPPSGAGNVTAPTGYVRTLGPASGVRSITVGASHACAVMTYGAMRCWGDAQYGQLGDGETVGINATPENVIRSNRGPLENVSDASGGKNTTCAVGTGNNVWCWGTSAAGATGFVTAQSEAQTLPASGTTRGFPATVKVVVTNAAGETLASTSVTLTRE